MTELLNDIYNAGNWDFYACTDKGKKEKVNTVSKENTIFFSNDHGNSFFLATPTKQTTLSVEDDVKPLNLISKRF